MVYISFTTVSLSFLLTAQKHNPNSPQLLRSPPSPQAFILTGNRGALPPTMGAPESEQD